MKAFKIIKSFDFQDYIGHKMQSPRPELWVEMESQDASSSQVLKQKGEGSNTKVILLTGVQLDHHQRLNICEASDG